MKRELAWCLGVLSITASLASAQFSLNWYTIDAGGGTSSGGSYTLTGTIGQHDAGQSMSAGSFTLSGGFWSGVGGGAPRCPADLDDGSGTGTPDGGVTIEDLLYYLAIFSDGAIAADLDDGSGTGTPDGGVTIEDLLYFLQHYSDGC